MAEKNWDRHVVDAEEVARTAGFAALREDILRRAAAGPEDRVVDVGAGTGLLTLGLPQVGKVWAVDISPPMCDYLAVKAESAGQANVQCVVASAISLPLVEGCADLVVSNYCFHHLDDPGKERALAEVHRVLRPGGRVVFGDMMFRIALGDARDRDVIAGKVRGMLAKGPAGVWRLAKNAGRLASRRWEHPAPVSWWEGALRQQGFTEIDVEALPHEGGIASAVRP